MTMRCRAGLTAFRIIRSHRIPFADSPSPLARDIPMQRLYLIACLLEATGYFFCHHHAAVLAAGTAEGDGQIALPFLNVVRKQVEHQLRYAIEKLPSLRESAHVGGNLGIEPCLLPELRHKVRIGKEANVENHVRIQRHAVLEAETQTGNQQALGFLFATDTV